MGGSLFGLQSLDMSQVVDEPEEEAAGALPDTLGEEYASQLAAAQELAAGLRPSDALLLYDDELDTHECMLATVRLVEKASELSPRDGAGPLPGWLEHLATSLEDPGVPRYVRLYLVKVILHVEARDGLRLRQQAEAAAEAEAAAAAAAGRAPPARQVHHHCIFSIFATQNVMVFAIFKPGTRNK